MGIGVGEGENRAVDAAKQAINSPLLETSIDGAKGILLNITGSEELSLFEINEAAEIISEAADPEANIIFGSVIDENAGDKVYITVVATGFGDQGSSNSFARKSPFGAGSNSPEVPAFMKR